MPTPPPPRLRYLDSDSTWAAIDRVAAEERPITLIVGAGTSMEAGLPSWNALESRMLETVIRTRLPERLHADWIGQVQAEGPLAAASIVETFYKQEKRFRNALRRALYGDRGPAGFHPQALAEQIAWFKQGEGDALTLVTTNYDGLLEAALERLGVPAHAYVSRRDAPAGSAAVYHLHGRLMPAYPGTGKIVLSEADYAHVQTPDKWQERLMTKLLRDTMCIFVGVSLRDANLIRWLYRYERPAGKPLHLALFVRQSQPDLNHRVRTRLEEANHERWRRRGVQVVDLDFFGETAQFIHEIAFKRRGVPGADFEARAAARHASGRDVFVPDPDTADFAATQQIASQSCAELAGVVADRLRVEGIYDRREDLGVGLWGVDHAAGTVTLWAASDRAFTSPDALIHNRLAYRSKLVGVQAVAQGTVLDQDLEEGARRWRLVRGMPLVKTDPDGACRSIVGALTITSTRPAADASLPKLPPDAWEALRDELEQIVVEAFA